MLNAIGCSVPSELTEYQHTDQPPLLVNIREELDQLLRSLNIPMTSAAKIPDRYFIDVPCTFRMLSISFAAILGHVTANRNGRASFKGPRTRICSLVCVTVISVPRMAKEMQQ